MNNNDIILGIILGGLEASRIAKKDASELISNMTTEEFKDIVTARFAHGQVSLLELEQELVHIRDTLYGREETREYCLGLEPTVHTLAEKAKCAASFAHHEFHDMVEVVHEGVLYQEQFCSCGYSVIQAFNVNDSGKITGPYRYDFTEAFMRALPTRDKIKLSAFAKTDEDGKVVLPADDDVYLEGGPY